MICHFWSVAILDNLVDFAQVRREVTGGLWQDGGGASQGLVSVQLGEVRLGPGGWGMGGWAGERSEVVRILGHLEPSSCPPRPRLGSVLAQFKTSCFEGPSLGPSGLFGLTKITFGHFDSEMEHYPNSDPVLPKRNFLGWDARSLSKSNQTGNPTFCRNPDLSGLWLNLW